MREFWKSSKKKVYLILAPVAIVSVFTALNSDPKREDRQEELQFFKASKINSTVVGLKDLSGGNYEVQLNVNGSLKTFSLPISYEVNKGFITLGDSLAKDAMNGNVQIFRVKDKANVIKTIDISFP